MKSKIVCAALSLLAVSAFAAPAVATAPASAAAKVAPAAKATTTTTTTVTKPAAPAPAPAATTVTTTTTTAAAPGQVWVNTASKSKVYHCAGTKYFGKTKKGEYMSVADAEAKGFKAAAGKACAAK